MNVYFVFPWCRTPLPFDFLSVLVVRRGAVCLPTLPSWFSPKVCFFKKKFRPLVKFPSWWGSQHFKHLLTPLLHSKCHHVVPQAVLYFQLLLLVGSFQVVLLTFLTDSFFPQGESWISLAYLLQSRPVSIWQTWVISLGCAQNKYKLVKCRLININLLKININCFLYNFTRNLEGGRVGICIGAIPKTF